MDTVIKRTRAALGMTQYDLAKASDLSPKTVCNIERGLQVPKVESAMKIAKVLRLRLNEIFADFVSHDTKVARPKIGYKQKKVVNY